MNDPTVYKNQPTITEILPVGDSQSERLDKGTNIEAEIYNSEIKKQGRNDPALYGR